MFQPDQPLGLPQGSVRALLALGLTGASIAAAFVASLPEEFLWPTTLIIIGHYFGAAPKRDGGPQD